MKSIIERHAEPAAPPRLPWLLEKPARNPKSIERHHRVGFPHASTTVYSGCEASRRGFQVAGSALDCVLWQLPALALSFSMKKRIMDKATRCTSDELTAEHQRATTRALQSTGTASGRFLLPITFECTAAQHPQPPRFLRPSFIKKSGLRDNFG